MGQICAYNNKVNNIRDPGSVLVKHHVSYSFKILLISLLLPKLHLHSLWSMTITEEMRRGSRVGLSKKT